MTKEHSPLSILPTFKQNANMTLQINNGAAPDADARRRMFDFYVEPRIADVRRSVEVLSAAGEDVDDNFQEVLIHLFQAIAFYDPASSNFLTWMDRVVTNKMNDIHRHELSLHKFWAASYDENDDDDGDDDDAPSFGVAPTVEPCYVAPDVPSLTPHPDDYPRTFAGLKRLPALQRRVLLLTSEGWTPADIATELRLTPASVYNLLLRARQTMAKSLEGNVAKVV